MENAIQAVQFLNKVVSDDRLKPVHIAICVALVNAWSKQDFRSKFNISRRVLMSDSRIRSFATYHKVIKEMCRFGYIQYNPSYHPQHGTTVSILS